MVETKKQKQSMRYSDKELELIKLSFAENDELLIAIRKVFLQLPTTALEQAILINLKTNEDLLKIIRKTFLPTIDGDAPFNQVIDLWMTIELKNKDPKEAYTEIMAREKLISYLEQQLKVLEGGVPSINDVQLSDLTKVLAKTKADEMLTNFVMRNTLIQHTEQQLHMFSILSGLKSETVEQTKERLKKDSMK
jgi:hypothetical protein